jgi:hypothetical protein
VPVWDSVDDFSRQASGRMSSKINSRRFMPNAHCNERATFAEHVHFA